MIFSSILFAIYPIIFTAQIKTWEMDWSKNCIDDKYWKVLRYKDEDPKVIFNIEYNFRKYGYKKLTKLTYLRTLRSPNGKYIYVFYSPVITDTEFAYVLDKRKNIIDRFVYNRHGFRDKNLNKIKCYI